MDLELNALLRDLRALPTHAIAFTVNWWMNERSAGDVVVQTSDYSFDLDGYAHYGHCELDVLDDLHVDTETRYNDDRDIISRTIAGAMFAVRWNEHTFKVLRLTWYEQRCRTTTHWLIGEQPALDEYFLEVCRWRRPTEPTVEVFEEGFWRGSRTLYKSIKSATFENLILADGMKQEIKTDLSTFFASQEIYDRYQIPWKRGVIFTGPPGNGKTHAVKALVNWLDRTALYVKSLQSPHRSEHAALQEVFNHARSSAPCILVFEDLESIVTPKNRSFFLNELDGFAANRGIVVLATTNHPERLDPALTERPSRFDRKYIFALPAVEERRAYLASWNEQIDPELKLTDNGIAAVAAATDGFSFAFLKELIMSSLMRWINLPEKPSMAVVMESQVGILRSQMTSEGEPIPSIELDLGEDEDDEEE